MRHIMAIYDVDPLYAARFADVVNQTEKIPFDVLAFSSFDKLKKFAKENPVELLLVAEGTMCPAISSLPVKKLVVLDEEKGTVPEELPAVLKYQSCEKIMQEVTALYGEEAREEGRGGGLPKGQCMFWESILLLDVWGRLPLRWP